MKPRLISLLILVGLAAAACSTGNPIASVGGVSITDDDVNGFYSAGEAGGEFDCTFDFLIANEVYVEAARTRLGVTVSGGDIDEYLASPPAHRADAVAALVDGAFSDEGIREQVRRWVLADRIVDDVVIGDDDLFASVVDPSAPDDVAREAPSSFMELEDTRRVLETWSDVVVADDDVADVVVDPLFGTWSALDLTTSDACAGAVLVRVGNVGITEGDVEALNDPLFPPTQEEFTFELQFLISSELYAQEAAERFAIEVTDEEIEAFIADPPPHRVTGLVQFQNLGRFSPEGTRAQVKRWMVADRVISELLRDEEETLETIADSVGLAFDEVAADPLAFLSLDEANSIFNAWTTEIANAGEFAEVQLDPLIGDWDPVFRRLIPAGA